EKPNRPTRYGHTFVMRDLDGDVFRRTRAAKGLRAKMTETPVSDLPPSRQDAPDAPDASWRRHGQLTHGSTALPPDLAIQLPTTAGLRSSIPRARLLRGGAAARPRSASAPPRCTGRPARSR